MKWLWQSESQDRRRLPTEACDGFVFTKPKLQMKIRQQLEQTLKRFCELEAMMSDPEILSGDSSKMANIMREHGGLLKVATLFRNYERMAFELKELAPMLTSSDPDECSMALEESNRLKEDRQTIWNGLLDMSIGGEDAARTRCVLEIRAGTGGEEAALFARDLYTMY